MSNRLTFAHVVPRREPHEVFAAPARPSALAAAARWLNGLVEHADNDLTPAVRRDLGLPERAMQAVAFNYEVERSRVRV